ncbi:MAG: hypothetical protein LBU89_03190 [Fibromonadaceae bacterium]|nr:hypothetical protein [Fibromonadaceae bacterium]
MRIILLVFIALLLSCSSVEKRQAVRADHESDMNIPAVDDLIVTMKKEYIERCYMPVMKRIPSNAPRPCETQLFQMLERRYSMNYTQEHVDMAADELFFRDVEVRLKQKIKDEPGLRRAVGRRFKNIDEMMDYYKPRYTFRKNG